MMKPFDSVLVRRLNKYPGTESRCTGKVVDSFNVAGPFNYDFHKDQTIYYRLIDEKYYSIVIDMETYDYLRLDCIFGVE